MPVSTRHPGSRGSHWLPVPTRGRRGAHALAGRLRSRHGCGLCWAPGALRRRASRAAGLGLRQPRPAPAGPGRLGRQNRSPPVLRWSFSPGCFPPPRGGGCLPSAARQRARRLPGLPHRPRAGPPFGITVGTLDRGGVCTSPSGKQHRYSWSI